MKNFYEKFVKKYDLNQDEIINVIMVGKDPDNQVLIVDLKGSDVLNLFGGLKAIRSIMKETLIDDYQISVLGKTFSKDADIIKMMIAQVLVKCCEVEGIDDDILKDMLDVMSDGVVCTVWKEQNAIAVLGLDVKDIMAAA